VLNSRLAELRAVAVIESGEDGYRLTAAGRELLEELLRLTAWSERWASSLRQYPATAPRGSRSRGG